MPLLKVCRCGKKIDYNLKHCDKCKLEVQKEKREKVKRYDREVRNSTENKRYTTFYNSTAWKTLSDIVKRNYSGLCVMCLLEKKEIIQSDTTHHITELKEDWNLRLVEDNLIPLCHDCHNNLHVDYTEREKEKLKILIKRFKKEFQDGGMGQKVL